MWDDVNEPEVDDAIAAVARELTAGRPNGGFRARVLGRIGGRESSPLHRAGKDSRPLFWIVPTAAMLVVAIVIVSMSDRGRAPHDNNARVPGTTAQPLQTERRAPAAGAHGAARPGVSASNETTSTPAARPQTLPRPPASVVAALAPRPLAPPSIALEPLPAPDVSEIESIQLSTLTVPPIDIAPLPSDDRSDMRRPQ